MLTEASWPLRPGLAASQILSVSIWGRAMSAAPVTSGWDCATCEAKRPRMPVALTTLVGRKDTATWAK